MRLESVEGMPLRVQMKEELRGGSFEYSDYQTVLVKAVCDGVEGWGEAMSRSDPRVNSLLVEFLSRSLVGKAVDSVPEAWGMLWRQLRVRGHTRGSAVEALSGIEMALFDCQGKLERRSLARLLTDHPADRTVAIAGSLFASRGQIESQAEEAEARGLRGAKVKVGFGVEEDLAVLRRVRKAWPDGVLVADANGAYDSAVARKACAAFEEVGLSWFEEPVLSDDLEGYAALGGSPVRLGAGESWFVHDFDLPIEERLVGVLEPSVSRCGGVGVAVEVGRKAAERGLGFSPMTGMNSGVSLAASIQLAAACPSEGVEFNPFTNPLQTELVHGLPQPKEGRVGVSTKPGLGIEVDLQYAKKHLVGEG